MATADFEENFVRLCLFALISDVATLPNTAVGKPSSAAGEAYGGIPSRANDGNT